MTSSEFQSIIWIEKKISDLQKQMNTLLVREAERCMNENQPAKKIPYYHSFPSTGVVKIDLEQLKKVRRAAANALRITKEKCYIAGKIGDLPAAEYKRSFEAAKAEVFLMGFEPVCPVDLPHNHGKTWSDYMREDLTEMLKCTTVYALRNWRQSPGATLEVNTALQVGLNIIHQKPAPAH